MMEITESLIAYCAEKVLGTTKITYQGLNRSYTTLEQAYNDRAVSVSELTLMR